VELVEADAYASRSWRDLLSDGANAEELTILFALSCDLPENPAAEFMEQLRLEGIREAQKALKLAKRLDEDRELLSDFRSSLPNEVLEQMQETGSMLRNSANEAREWISRHNLNTTFFLAWLVSSLKEKVGSPRYREVATLMKYAYAAYGRDDFDIGEEALRKTYSRFMKDRPLAKVLTPEGKRNIVLVAAIVALFRLVRSAAPGTQYSPPPEPPFAS
jgi:hypothetical protein